MLSISITLTIMVREIKFRIYTEIKPGIFGMKYFDLSDTSEKNSTIMQFTGFLDRNKKEIYEGDIIKTTRTKNNGLYKVFWNVSSGAVNFQLVDESKSEENLAGFIESFDFSDRYGWETHVEIISNIFEYEIQRSIT